MPLITSVFKVMSLQPDVPRCELEDLAEISRPGSTWKRHRNGTRGGAVQSNHTRTNWYHPYLWPSIDKMAKRANWSPQETVKRLKTFQPELFSRLNRGTVHRWISASGKGWSDETLKNVARRGTLTGSGRVGVLAPYPNMVVAIKKKLTEFRDGGVPVNVLVARSVILALIQTEKPQLLEKFKCSEVRLILVMQNPLRRRLIS